MKASARFFRAAAGLTVAAAAMALVSSAPAEPIVAPAKPAACSAPVDLVRLQQRLPRVAQHIAAGHALTVVAIGSSSTYGAGASTDQTTYPSRLEVELKTLLPRLPIKVLNRGVSGEESKDMLARFDHDVFADNPDLVLWQVGSNSVLRDRPLSEANASLRAGIKRLRDAGIDVVLINPQYSPKVITKHDIDGMIALLDLTAKEANVDLFQRYRVMQHWNLAQGLPFETFVSPDGLHMNDWGYGCWAKLLAGAIQEASTRATSTAVAGTR